MSDGELTYVHEPSVLRLRQRIYLGPGAVVRIEELPAFVDNRAGYRTTIADADGEGRELVEYGLESAPSIRTVEEQVLFDRQAHGGRGPAEYRALVDHVGAPLIEAGR